MPNIDGTFPLWILCDFLPPDSLSNSPQDQQIINDQTSSIDFLNPRGEVVQLSISCVLF